MICLRIKADEEAHHTSASVQQTWRWENGIRDASTSSGTGPRRIPVESDVVTREDTTNFRLPVGRKRQQIMDVKWANQNDFYRLEILAQTMNIHGRLPRILCMQTNGLYSLVFSTGLSHWTKFAHSPQDKDANWPGIPSAAILIKQTMKSVLGCNKRNKLE